MNSFIHYYIFFSLDSNQAFYVTFSRTHFGVSRLSFRNDYAEQEEIKNYNNNKRTEKFGKE